MYGCKFALVPEEPVEAIVVATVIPVVFARAGEDVEPILFGPLLPDIKDPAVALSKL
jgi:hypothetical protein